MIYLCSDLVDKVRCHHCGTVGNVGEDHTCPCPYHDNDCPGHP